MTSSSGPLPPGLTAQVFELCLLRGAPQDLPYSPRLLVALIVAGTAADAFAGSLVGDLDGALARSLLSTFVVLALCRLALVMRDMRNRFVQTASALTACGLVFSLVQLPLALIAVPIPAPGTPLSGMHLLVGWATLGLLVWQLAVSAHIMRHAIESSFGLAFALVVSWLIAYWALLRLLFGAAG